jgi:hypothetical protein
MEKPMDLATVKSEVSIRCLQWWNVVADRHSLAQKRVLLAFKLTLAAAAQ